MVLEENSDSAMDTVEQVAVACLCLVTLGLGQEIALSWCITWQMAGWIERRYLVLDLWQFA